MTHRLSVNINDECKAALTEVAARRGVSVTEAVRQAISIYKFVDDELAVKGASMKLTYPEGNQKEVVVIP